MLTRHTYRDLGVLQKEFSSSFPFLKIAFEDQKSDLSNLPCSSSRLVPTGIHVSFLPDQTVEELMRLFRNLLGIPVHVFRKTGEGWLEITRTAHWTLEEQNRQGRELSLKETSTPIWQ